MNRLVPLALISACISSAVLTSACDESKPAPTSPSSNAPDGSRIDAMRADWLKRWKQFPALPECMALGEADRPLCSTAIAKREALKVGEEKSVAPAEHLKLAAEAADAAAAAGEKLELSYMQKLVLRADPKAGDKGKPPAATPSAAPSVAALSSSAPSPAPSGSAEPKNGVMAAVEAAKHGENRDRDPLQLAAFQYYNAERDALLRIAGYIREGAPADRETAIELFKKHANRHPKSTRARQLLNEAIILVSDKALRDRLRKIRTEMGPGAVPAPSASAEKE
ncbi:MAG: hypothetical protein H6718_24360 [Polyangiaceae bacterium]|nr:hypothetical protein [Polyangiaceae bacterium]